MFVFLKVFTRLLFCGKIKLSNEIEYFSGGKNEKKSLLSDSRGRLSLQRLTVIEVHVETNALL